MQKNEIKRNFETTMERVAKACSHVGRDPSDVKVIVVTKKKSPEAINEVIAAGALDLGENYPEETFEKIRLINTQAEIRWHMIGHLQSRKAKIVAEHFKMMHSLDSEKIASKLNFLCHERGRILDSCLEINISGETTKGGFSADDEKDWEKLIPYIKEISEYPNINLRGLMVMPPWSTNPENSRRYFIKTRKLLDFLGKQNLECKLTELSMGTSMDYEVAIQEGATYVRIGEAILGRRDG